MVTRSVPSNGVVELVRQRWPVGDLLAARLRTGPWTALAVERWDTDLANGWVNVLLEDAAVADAYLLEDDGYWSWVSVAVVPETVHDILDFFDDGDLFHLASRTVAVPDAAFADTGLVVDPTDDPLFDALLSLCVGLAPVQGEMRQKPAGMPVSAQVGAPCAEVRVAALYARAAVGAAAVHRTVQRCGKQDRGVRETAEMLWALAATRAET